MNQSKKTVSKKFFPLFAAFIIVIAGIIWFVQSTTNQVSIPFSSVEKIIQEQNRQISRPIQVVELKLIAGIKFRLMLHGEDLRKLPFKQSKSYLINLREPIVKYMAISITVAQKERGLQLFLYSV